MLENHTSIFATTLRNSASPSVVKSVPFTITEPDVGASSMLMHRINVGFTSPRLTDNTKDFTFFNIEG